MIKNKFNNNVSLIKKAINNDKLVIFAGAGVSKDSGIPLWNELIDDIKNYLNEDIYEDDPLKIAQILYNEKGEKEYNDIIKNLLYKNKSIYNPIHEIIFDLNPQHIITTNYDHYFEDIIKNTGLPFSVISKDIDLPYAEYKNLLIKYHGDFENKNVIFKETDYLEFSKNNTLKEIFVKSLFSNKVILFVGYRVGDINLKLLIREIQFILTKHHQRAYLLSHNLDIPDSEIKYFENLGINIINYCDQSLCSIKDNDDLSSIGQSVYKQLEYIRDFDLFEYERCKRNISLESKLINDLYNSLHRFYYFKVLPKNLLATLFPLNKNSKNNKGYNIRGNILTSNNEELFDLIKNYNGVNDSNLNREEKRKLDFSISRLLYSNIYFIAKRGEERSLEKHINLIDKYSSNNENCDCIDCNIGFLRYSNAIHRIEEYNITDNSKLEEDLIYAYSLYQMREYYKSYKAYEQIEIKSNRLKQMDVSFISVYNMKRIGSHIQNLHLLDPRYSYDNLQEIENLSKKIDLDKNLSKSRYFVDEDIYNFLKEVRDGIYIQRLCNEIDDFYNKIPKDLDIIKQGGAVNSPDYFNLYNAVKQLNDFLKGSFIIGNGFSAIEYSINKSIKTFILGFYIGTLKLNFSQKGFIGISKLDSFNHFLFELMIDYSDPKELSNFIAKQNISNIQFDDESQNQVFNCIINFFQSAYTIDNIRSKKTFVNKIFINYLNYSYNFNKKIIHQFKNICIVLTYFEFSESHIKSIFSDLNIFIHYITFASFVRYEDYKYLITFINTKYEIIGYDLLLETLNILNSETQIYNELYTIILERLKDLNIEFINEGSIYDTIESVNLNEIRYNIPIIYNTLPVKKRNSFIKKIEEQLKPDFDNNIINELLLEGIPLKKELKNKYIKTIHEKLEFGEQILKDDDYKMNFLIMPIIQYIELINLGVLKDPKLSSLNIVNEFFKFIVSPRDYDKSKFDIEWLEVFYYYDSYIDIFSKIEYIIEKLEYFLIDNDNGKLNEIYFKLKKKSHNKI
ncbi:SIR2 family protein [Elizabethkingia meningoseptica]|uniref:SIR2 family protein n=1 Tax=Elizabethkingia meningoseptica TaxID=238 RepID=UPI00389245F1